MTPQTNPKSNQLNFGLLVNRLKEVTKEQKENFFRTMLNLSKDDADIIWAGDNIKCAKIHDSIKECSIALTISEALQ